MVSRIGVLRRVDERLGIGIRMSGVCGAAPKRVWKAGRTHSPRLRLRPGPGNGISLPHSSPMAIPLSPYHLYPLRYPIASPTTWASFCTFFAAYGRLRPTVTLHNHSSGASMAPTLGYLLPYPLPLPPASISYAYYTLTKKCLKKVFQITHPGVFRPSRLHAFTGCSNQYIQSQTLRGVV